MALAYASAKRVAAGVIHYVFKVSVMAFPNYVAQSEKQRSYLEVESQAAGALECTSYMKYFEALLVRSTPAEAF
jgi:hypothetical protein